MIRRLPKDVVDRIAQVSTFPNRSPYHRVVIETARIVGSERSPPD